MTTTVGRPVPPLAEPRPAKLPVVAEQVLDNGLRVLAVRRRGVPLAELATVHARAAAGELPGKVVVLVADA